MKLARRLEHVQAFALFVAGTDTAVSVLVFLGWAKLDTAPRQIALGAYLLITLAAIYIPSQLAKRAVKRQAEEERRQADQWQPVPGRPGVLQREAVVEYHGLPSTETPRTQTP